MHLVIDGIARDPEQLADAEAVRVALIECARRIGMEPAAEPLVVQLRASHRALPGVTGVLLLKESHITVHTAPEESWMAIDVFSCHDFDGGSVLRFFADHFAFTRSDVLEVATPQRAKDRCYAETAP